jgi:hypothetical protein
LIETEIVTINDHSAWPAIITRPQGPFFLMIRNRTRTLTGLSLSSANAPSGVAGITQGLNLSNVLNQRHSSGYLNPPPGTYSLSDATSGTVLLQIVIN